MVMRTETSTATRLALVHAAAELLDEGGLEAVTLRAVGARAGVTRGAPYGHFANKEHLLSQLVIGVWNSLADEVAELRANVDVGPDARLERAVLAFIEVGRRWPHRYELMLSTPANGPEAVEASSRLQDEFVAIIAGVVGDADALRYCALLISCAHGIAAMELKGLLAKETWDVNAEQLVRMLTNAVRCGVQSTES